MLDRTNTDNVLIGDSLDLLKNMSGDSVHMILSDIPYGIGLDDWDVLHKNSNSAFQGTSPAQKKAGKVFKRRGKPINGWSSADKNIPMEYYNWCMKWLPECYRILKPGGSIMIFAGRRYAHRCICAIEDSGFNFRDLLGWKRGRAVHRAQRLSVVFSRRGDKEFATKWEGWRLGNLRPVFEPIIWGFKPYKLTIADNAIEHELGAYNQDSLEKNFGHIDNIFSADYRRNERGYHEAQKPVDLLKGLIEMTTREGQIVLDPFCGSGSTAVAALESHRKFIMIENDPRLGKIIDERIRNTIGDSIFLKKN